VKLRPSLSAAGIAPLLLVCALSCVMVGSCEKSSGGSEFMPIPSGVAQDGDPEWSPDGTTIVYEHVHVVFIDGVLTPIQESTGFWFISPDGSNNRMLQSYQGFTHMDWSPDGQWFLFGLNCEIWKMRATGDSLTLVLSDSTGRNYRPTWSPDGRRIAFDRFQEDGKTGIYTMAANGTDLRYLGYGAEPDWAPDGKHIVCAGINSIEIMDTSGNSRETLLTLTTYTDLGTLAYSPDGSKLAFVGVVNKVRGVFAVDIAGRNIKLLDKGGCLPSWSPDGKRIVFVNTAQVWMPSLGKHEPGQFLYIINADGTRRRQLTFIPGQ